MPWSFWISLALALMFAVSAVVQVLGREPRAHHEIDSASRPAFGDRLRDLLAPWRWSPARLLAFAVFNCALAAGLSAGFSA